MLAPGTKLGPYTILDVVAIGGMGEVYRAEDARLHRDVAIKVLPSHLAADRASLERFHREARAVAALSHPNILSIFDVGSENGVHYAVTELLEGENLRAHLLRKHLEPRAALELMLEIADGVAAAHARGIVHRDLKPENIFITRAGRVKVLDFGIARTTASLFAPGGMTAPTEMLPTEPGVVMGTVGYLAPEQADARTPTPAADVFALGCILYELIAGRLPFERTSYARAMAALMNEDAPPLDADKEIDALVQHCLAKNPEDRLPDAGALAREIRALLVEGRTLSPPRRTGALRARRSIIAAVAAVVVLSALLAFERYRHRQLDHGYDIRASDVRGDAEAKRLFALGLRADADGNRKKAIEFLEEADRRGAPSALPAAFLSTFANEAASKRWKDIAAKKLAGASTYESLLTRYLFIVGENLDQELALSKSILELRPDAWRLRLGSAHVHLERREREAARRELQRIDITKPDDRRLMLVLADRASLGDADGAERDLHASRIWNRPALRYYTEGRIAWSRGDARRAAEAYEKSAQEAAAEGLSLEVEGHLLAGIAHVRLRSWSAAQRELALCTTRARQLELDHRVFAASAYAAYAAHRLGDAEERDRKLAVAMSVKPPAGPVASLRLLAIRMRSPVWKTWSKDAIEKDPLLAATAALIRAREAWYEGDADTAKRELTRARAEGIDVSADREEAELLAYELGLPHQILPADPPYPNNLRYLAIFELENRAGSNLPQ